MWHRYQPRDGTVLVEPIWAVVRCGDTEKTGSATLCSFELAMVFGRGFVKINGEAHYLWRAVYHEGEAFESYVSKHWDRKSALKFLRKTMNRFGSPHVIMTDLLRSYGATMKVIGNADRQETGRLKNNRAENSHPLPGSGLFTNHEKGPFRRRERAMQRFKTVATLQKFVSHHSQIYNHFNHERHLETRQTYKQKRSAALAEWFKICAS